MPAEEATRCLYQAKQYMESSLSLVMRESVANCLNEIVYHQLVTQMGDILNGLKLCAETLEEK